MSQVSVEYGVHCINFFVCEFIGFQYAVSVDEPYKYAAFWARGIIVDFELAAINVG